MVYDVWLLIVAVWFGSVVTELSAGLIGRGWLSKLLSLVGLLSSSVAIGMVLGVGFNVLSVLFLIVGLYRLINVTRIFAARLEPKNLRRVATRATMGLTASQAILLAADHFWPAFPAEYWLIGLTVAELVVGLIFLVAFNRRIRQSRYQPSKINLSERQLPTLTVAIPARDETAALEECLVSVLASDYPKLEVLVLDDSAGSRTGQIINSLAHEGVQFILGEEPTSKWLAKNLAYDRLAKEANGQIIVFCGVDVRFGRSSLRQIVTTMLAHQKHMVSVMPINGQQPKSRLFQPMRYFWELARPRLKSSSQPVLSTCWAISKVSLAKAGGFRAVMQSVVPERYFAGLASREKASYQFLRANKYLDITSLKPSREQRHTAVRTRYPLLHRRITWVMLASLFELTAYLAPLALIIILPLYGWSLIAEAAAVLAVIMWLAIYGGILNHSFKSSRLFSPLFFLAALADVWLMNLSMLKYEFGSVFWKGREVAVQVVNPEAAPAASDLGRERRSETSNRG